MRFSKKRREAIDEYIFRRLLHIVDGRTASELSKKILPSVIKDIKETADWSNYDADEYNTSDIDIAVSRVFAKKFHIEV